MFDSARELAREIGVDNKTIITWIKKGKIKAYKRKGKAYKIPEKESKKINKLKKPYVKWQMPWTQAEENLIIYSSYLKDKEIAKIIGRSISSVRVHKTIMRKKGLL